MYDLVFLYNDEDVLHDMFESVSEFGSEVIQNGIHKITCDYEQFMLCMNLYTLYGFKESYAEYLANILYTKSPSKMFNIPEELAVKVVQHQPMAIKWLKNQTVKVQLSAVEKFPSVFYFIDKPYDETRDRYIRLSLSNFLSR